MTRKRSHQDFMDLSIDEPLSPVLRPPRQTMHSNDSGSDGDEIMGMGIASPRSQVEQASEWALLDSQAASGALSSRPGADTNRPDVAESAPTWGQVLNSLKTWGITPSSQSAAASPVSGRDHMTRVHANDPTLSQSQHSLGLDSRNSVLNYSEHAELDIEGPDMNTRSEGTSRTGTGPVLSRPASAGAAFATGANQESAAVRQKSDRLSSSLDNSQVEPWPLAFHLLDYQA